MLVRFDHTPDRIRGHGLLVATLSLMLTTAACKPGDREPEAEPPPKLFLDTVAVIHSELLHYVRNVRWGPDGNLVVMGMFPASVQLLNTAGDLVGTVGRPGEGPGEFRGVLDMDTKGDSILLLDGLARRVLLFHRQSAVATWSLRDLPGIPQQVAFTADGAPVVSVVRRPELSRTNAMRVLRETIEFHRVDDPVTALETPVRVPGGEIFVSWDASGTTRTGRTTSWSGPSWTGPASRSAHSPSIRARSYSRSRTGRSSAWAATRWTWSTCSFCGFGKKCKPHMT